jgi:hypothetical protein
MIWPFLSDHWAWGSVILVSGALLYFVRLALRPSEGAQLQGVASAENEAPQGATTGGEGLHGEVVRLLAENSRLASSLEAYRLKAEMLERALHSRSAESNPPESTAAPSLRADQVKGLRADIEALQGFADLTDRWHDQMTLVIRNNVQLKEQLESFEKIVKSFDVVAINAAIMAAKAGVHGRGFGVVAGFVRELSSKTAREASEYMRMVDYNTMITSTTFQEIQASGSLIKTAMFSLKTGVDRLKQQ